MILQVPGIPNSPGTGLDPGLLGMLSGVDCQLHFSLSGEQGSVL